MHIIYCFKYADPSIGGPEIIPPGWSDWHGLVGQSRYYNYTISHNGVPIHSDDLYLTDIIVSHLFIYFIIVNRLLEK